MKRRRELVGLSFLTALSLGPLPAAASGGVPVEFSFEECADPLQTEIARIARIELHATAPVDGVATQIALACVDDNVRITVNDPITGKQVERTVSLAKVGPRARPRLLALAIAELVRSSWIELELHRTPVLPIVSQAPVTVEQQDQARVIATDARTSAFHGSAAIEVLYLPSVGRPLFGLSLAVQHDFAPWWFVELGLDGSDGSVDRTAFSVAVRQIAFDPALGFRWSILDFEIAAHVGWASLSGSSATSAFVGNTTSGPVAGPLGTVSLKIVGPLRIALKAGGLLHGQTGTVQGGSDVTVGGFYGSLGLGLRFGS